MPENDFLGKILSESIPINQPLLADQLKQVMAHIPKEPTMSEILNNATNKQSDYLGQKEAIKAPTENPKYVLSRQNFAKLIDISDVHDSKIQMVYCKAIDLEDTQNFMQKELNKINAVLKKHEATLSIKDFQNMPSSLIDRFLIFFSKDIHWKSFAGGVLALAAILALIYTKF